MMSRRNTLMGLSGITAATILPGGCGPTATTVTLPATRPGRGFVFKKSGETLVSEVSGFALGAPFSVDRPFRVASITKAFVAEMVRALKREGVLTGQEEATLIDAGLRHPEFPETPITLDHLIQHRSGLRDPDVYWMAAPGNIRDLIVPEIFEAGAKPGEAFRYCNFNYGLAATLIEQIAGERQDQLFQRTVAQPLGLDIGLNWWGMSEAKRATGIPLYRGSDGDWTLQVDGPENLADPMKAILHADGWSPEDYTPGDNGTLFSPQGGLRASMADLMSFGERVLLQQPDLWDPTWVLDQAPTATGPSEGAHFVAFGDGLYIYPANRSPIPGVRLVGHHGEAYGGYFGLWVAPDHEAVFVHADLGSPTDGPERVAGLPENTIFAVEAFARAGALINA